MLTAVNGSIVQKPDLVARHSISKRVHRVFCTMFRFARRGPFTEIFPFHIHRIIRILSSTKRYFVTWPTTALIFSLLRGFSLHLTTSSMHGLRVRITSINVRIPSFILNHHRPYWTIHLASRIFIGSLNMPHGLGPRFHFYCDIFASWIVRFQNQQPIRRCWRIWKVQKTLQYSCEISPFKIQPCISSPCQNIFV